MSLSRTMKFLGTGIVYGILFIVLAIVTILFIRSTFAPYLDNPPVNIIPLDGPNLGPTCPGDDLSVHNVVEIEKPVVAVYYVSILDSDSIYNIIGTQRVYNGFQHPVAGIFTHTIPYETPLLPPGTYVRSFAARGTNTEEKTVFVTSTLTISLFCLQETNHAKSSPNHRISEDGNSDSYSLARPDGLLADE